MQDSISIVITTVLNSLKTVLKLTRMETALNAKNIINLIHMETVSLFLKDQLMKIVQSTNMEMLKEPCTRNGSKVVIEFVRSVKLSTVWTTMENAFWALIHYVSQPTLTELVMFVLSDQ